MHMTIAKKSIFLFTALLLLSGCGFHRKEARQEAEILGSVGGYNKKIEEAQRSLKKAGLDFGPIDGKMGWKTREAIKNFQRNNGLKENGFIDTATWARLSAYEDSKRLPTSVRQQDKSKPKGERYAGRSVLSKDKQMITPEIIKVRLQSSVWVKKIQQALKSAGFDPGRIDGKMGPRTKKAIAEFQKSKGLSADGIIDQKTWEALSSYFPTVKTKE